jgi:cysteine sulfinate desulfinase/cysteine desulfurase-like protein
MMTLLLSVFPSLEVRSPSAFTFAPVMALPADMHKVIPHMNSTMILIFNLLNCIPLHSSLSLLSFRTWRLRRNYLRMKICHSESFACHSERSEESHNINASYNQDSSASASE